MSRYFVCPDYDVGSINDFTKTVSGYYLAGGNMDYDEARAFILLLELNKLIDTNTKKLIFEFLESVSKQELPRYNDKQKSFL